MMGDFHVHHVQFFDFVPQAVHSMAYSESLKKLAVARCMQSDNIKEVSLASIEIWNTQDTWYQEQVFPPIVPVETLLFCGHRLFSGGMDEQLHEHNIQTGRLVSSSASNNGAIWCLASNSSHSYVAAGTEGGCIVLFEINENNVQYSKVFSNQGDRILSIAWYDVMNIIITGGIDNIRVWNVQSGQAVRRLCVERTSKNMETIVSALAVIKDFIIVSGDSRGHTCFWDGRTGTQIKSLRSHVGPVFALGVAAEGACVLTSGADPSLIQFEFVSDVGGDKWVRTATKSQHTHDVRSIICTRNHVISAGVDGKLVVNTAVDEKLATSSSLIIAPVPRRPLVHTAGEARSILLQYPNRVELWSLGSTSKTSDEDTAILDLDTTPLCRVTLSARDGYYIHCSAVSSDACWIAYSDQRSLRLFKISSGIDSSASASVTRVRCLTEVSSVCCLEFSHDNDRLFVATTDAHVHIINLHLTHPTIAKVLDVSRDCHKSVHCNSLSVSASGHYLAVSDATYGVHIYQLKKQKYLCTVPVSVPTAIAFHKTQPLLLVSSANRMLVEYNIKHREYTTWSRDFGAYVPTQWRKRKHVIQRVFYGSTDDKIFVYDDEIFCIIDKNEQLPEKSVKLFQSEHSQKKTGKHGAIHVCQRFKYLMFVDLLPDNSLVIVERSLSAMLESLPPMLRRKKFSVG